MRLLTFVVLITIFMIVMALFFEALLNTGYKLSVVSSKAVKSKSMSHEIDSILSTAALSIKIMLVTVFMAVTFPVLAVYALRSLQERE